MDWNKGLTGSLETEVISDSLLGSDKTFAAQSPLNTDSGPKEAHTTG